MQLAKDSNVLSVHVICSQHVHYSGPFLWLSCPVKCRALADDCTAITCPSIHSLSTQHTCIIASGHLACCGHVQLAMYTQVLYFPNTPSLDSTGAMVYHFSGVSSCSCHIWRCTRSHYPFHTHTRTHARMHANNQWTSRAL